MAGLNRKTIFISLGFVLVCFWIAFFSIYMYGESLKIEINPVQYFNWNWRTYTDNKIYPSNEKTGYIKLEVSENTPIYLERALPDVFSDSKYIAIRGSLQKIKVFLEDEQIYKRDFKTEHFLKMPIASAWHFVKVPENSNGKTIKIELESPYEDMSGVLNPIMFGSYGDLVAEIIKTHFPAFILSSLIVLMGVILVILGWIIKFPDRNQFLYLGFFALGLGLWLIVESRCMQFFIGSNFYLGSSAYLMLSLFPIPLLLLVKDYIVTEFQTCYKTFIYIFIVNTLGILFAQLFDVADFYITVRITHFIIFVASLMILITMSKAILKHKNSEAYSFAKALVVLIVFGFFELIHFYFFGVVSVSFWVRVGFFLFICLLVVEAVKKLIQFVKSSLELQYFQKLAYEDRVTGGANRLAFEEDFEECFNHCKREGDLILLLFDLNHLKFINDAYGHVEGDHAIRLGYQCISSSFGAHGKCYRIGGDEYACLLKIHENTSIDFNKMIDSFMRCVESTNKKVTYPFGIAFGEVKYHPDIDKTAKLMMARADVKMYENKAELKSQQIESGE